MDSYTKKQKALDDHLKGSNAFWGKVIIVALVVIAVCIMTMPDAEAKGFNAESSKSIKDSARLAVRCFAWDPYDGGVTLNTDDLDVASKVLGQAASSFEFGRAYGMASKGMKFNQNKAIALYNIYCLNK